MADDKDTIGIHVIGCGVGECILIEFPNSPPGLVDCGCQEVADYILLFLHQILGVDSLSFLAMSHPHEDHMEGLATIVESFKGKIGELWAFPGFLVGDAVYRFLRYANDHAEGVVFDKKLFSRTVAKEWEAVSRWKTNNKKVIFRKGSSRWDRPYHPPDDPGITINCLLPSSQDADDFEYALSRCAPSWDWLDTLPDPSSISLTAAPLANSASSVLLIQWESVNVLLCGDAELLAWEGFVATGGRLPEPLACLKVGHHGSRNGTPNAVLANLSGATHAVITPYVRGHVKLPDVEVLDCIADKCKSLQVTAITDHLRERESVDDLGLPVDFVREIASACHGESNEAAAILSTSSAELLGEEGRNHVSFYFDKNGNPVKVIRGDGVLPYK